MKAKPVKVEVYGQPHSPWVQAVLLALHDRGIEYSLTTLPNWSLFREFGVLMPIARVDGGPWQPESAAILERIGLDAVTAEEQLGLLSAWRGVFHRTDSVFGFVGGFAQAGDPNPNPLIRTWRNFWRSFVTLYFLLRIRHRVATTGYRDPAEFGSQFLPWQERLSEGVAPYFGGDEPNSVDYQLMGVIQCHASIPVPPLDALRNDERLDVLRGWLGRMHERLSSYPWLYSGPWFEPERPPPPPASPLAQGAFWTGFVLMVLSAPVSILVAVLLMRRVNRRLAQAQVRGRVS